MIFFQFSKAFNLKKFSAYVENQHFFLPFKKSLIGSIIVPSVFIGTACLWTIVFAKLQTLHNIVFESALDCLITLTFGVIGVAVYLGTKNRPEDRIILDEISRSSERVEMRSIEN